MSNKFISMVLIRRILQLRDEGISKNKIAELLKIHRQTLDSYLNKITDSGKSYPQLLQLSDGDLSEIVHPTSIAKADKRFEDLEKRFADFKADLDHPGVTRKILWEEYQKVNIEGYKYTQFCEHFARFMQISKATMHLTHRPGEFMQLDFAGQKLRYIDRVTGEVIYCPVLVCTLPFSCFVYVEALPSMVQAQLFSALNRCLEYFGGVPRNILSDNMKQYIIKNDRYEFSFTELADQWSVHYNTNLDATRPRRPKDKPTVENSVYVSYLRIYAKLRHEDFFSLKELNERIQMLLVEFNKTKFQKLPGSRAQRFLEEKPFLKPLPAEPFTIKYTTKAKVQFNYHVFLGEDKHYYSVPCKFIGQSTKIIYDQEDVEIFIGFQRIYSYKRDYSQNYTTIPEHMPEKHQKYNESIGWNEDFFLTFAAKIGENSLNAFKKVLESRIFVEQSYKACLGLKRLSERYGNNRFEAACMRALMGSRINYGMIKNILEKNLDKAPIDNQNTLPDITHDNIRGPQVYV